MSWAVAGQAAASILPGVGAYFASKENAKAQRAANKTAEGIAKDQMAQQEMFGRNGIQIKALDARKAGISPLAAMGAQTFSPNAITPQIQAVEGTPWEAMGQSLGRAASAVATEPERQAAASQLTAMNSLQLENQSLQNDLLRLNIAKIANPGNPAMPGVAGPTSNSNLPLLTGQGNSTPTGGKYVVENALSRVHSSPGQPAQEVGTVSDYGFVQTPTGLSIVPSNDVKQKIEDQTIPEIMWAVRNQLMPNLNHFGIAKGGPTPPDPKYYPPPKGSTRWVWNPLYQEFQGNNAMGTNRNKR